MRQLETKFDATDIYSMICLLDITCNIKAFKKWINEKYPTIRFMSLFSGYKYYIISSIKILINRIEYNSGTNIQEDRVAYRIEFINININKLPNTCEKILFYKNLYRLVGLIKGAKNEDELKSALSILYDRLIIPLKKLLKINSAKVKLDKEQKLIMPAIYYNWLFLTDNQRWRPNGSFISFLDINEEKDNGNRLEGYKYTLQYSWYILLGAKFDRTSAKNMHLAQKWRAQSFFDKEFYNKNIINLDSFWGKLRDEIINKNQLNLDNKYFAFLNKDINKKTLPALFNSLTPAAMNLDERLDYFFLWYHLEILDSRKSHSFNGVFAFNTMLLGAVEIRKKFNIGDKVIVRRIKHPLSERENDTRSDYSYAILSEVHGSFSDSSGWILFKDCCNDFSGLGGSEHYSAEYIIKKLLAEGVIEIEEFSVPLEVFNKYLQKKSINDREHLEDKMQHQRQLIDDARGLLLELLVYYIKSKEKHISIDWSIDRIDILVETEEEYLLIECKNKPTNINIPFEYEKAFKKMETIKSKKEKRIEFWFYYEPSKITRELLRKEKIQFFSLEKFIDNSPILKDKEKDKIKNIFDIGR